MQRTSILKHLTLNLKRLNKKQNGHHKITKYKNVLVSRLFD